MGDVTGSAGGEPGRGPSLSGLALLSLVCGGAGILFCVTAPFGLVFGIAAFPVIALSGGRLRGHGHAAVGIALSVLWMWVYRPMGHPGHRHKAMQAACMSNLRQMSAALHAYADEHGALPPADAWCDAIAPQFTGRDIFRCPAAPKRPKGECHYVFNERLSGLPVPDGKVPLRSDVVLVTEGEAGWNRVARGKAMARHVEGANVLFLDGHVKWVKGEDIAGLQWDPDASAAD